jgi:predicted nucleic acid-binding protein
MIEHPAAFVDSVYLIGLFVDRDQWRRASLAAEQEIGDRHLYTSDGVVQEVLAHVSRYGTDARAEAAGYVRALRSDRRVTVVGHSERLVELGLSLYDGEFRHSNLSLVDCIAIQIMRDFGITEILTADQEFAVAGLTPLLRRYI